MTGPAPRIRFHDLGRDRGFAAGTLAGLVSGDNGALRIDDTTAGATGPASPRPIPPESGDQRGVWTSPVIETGFPAGEAVLSWHAVTPTATWLEAALRVRGADGCWSRWFVLGHWAGGDDFASGDIRRTTIDGQSDAAGRVLNDTFRAAQDRPFHAFQVRATLVRPAGSTAPVQLAALYAMASAPPSDDLKPTSAFTLDKGLALDVPRFPQMIHAGCYPAFAGGGAAWCSPTATSMVLYYWGRKVGAELLESIEAPQGDPHIIWAAQGVYDHGYEGTGNWAFNAAYAAGFGLRAFVTRLRSLAEAEAFIALGIPLVVSVSFTREELPQAGYDTDGHLLVISGFTGEGNVIVNDPGAASSGEVRRELDRAPFESAWLKGSGGITYVFHPPGVPLPPSPGEPNW